MTSVGGVRLKKDEKIYLVKMKKKAGIQDGLWVDKPNQATKIKNYNTPHYFAYSKKDVASVKTITPAKARKLLKSEDAGWVE